MQVKNIVIVNPRAAAGKVRKRLVDIEAAVSDSFGPCEVRASDETGGVTRLVSEAVNESVERLIIVGGDGTVNEAINGFADPSTGELMKGCPPMVFLPSGTGCDFARSIGASGVGIVGALQNLTFRTIDVGRIVVTDDDGERVPRYFLNIASIGVSAAIAQNVNLGSKRLGGKAAFAVAAVTTLFSWRDRRVRLRIDDSFDEELTVSAVVVANGRFFGGGMKVAPHAVLDDGLFDVIIMEGLGVFKFVMNSRKVYRGEHLDVPGIRSVRGKKISMEPLDDMGKVPAEMDGEHPGFLPVECTIIEGGVRVLAPWSRTTTVGLTI